jgi:hypothetical protein
MVSLKARFHGKNSAASLYLFELLIQCQIAKHAFTNVQAWSLFQLRLASQRPGGYLFADCAAFLSAAGVVAKMLYAGAGKSDTQLRDRPEKLRAARRSAALRSLLKIAELPTLQQVAVRNSFEHIDERIDKLLRENPSRAFIAIHAAKGDPDNDALVLKHFDPVAMTVSYLDDAMQIETCMEEILQVHKMLGPAFTRVREDAALLAAAQ